MDIELTTAESEAVQAALRTYLSDLRMEISDTDNAAYKRTLRSEREALQSALAKLDGACATAGGDVAASEGSGDQMVTVVRLWWSLPR